MIETCRCACIYLQKKMRPFEKKNHRKDILIRSSGLHGSTSTLNSDRGHDTPMQEVTSDEPEQYYGNVTLDGRSVLEVEAMEGTAFAEGEKDPNYGQGWDDLGTSVPSETPPPLPLGAELRSPDGGIVGDVDHRWGRCDSSAMSMPSESPPSPPGTNDFTPHFNTALYQDGVHTSDIDIHL